MIVSPPKPSTPVAFSAATSDAPPRASEVAAKLADLPGSVLDGGEIVLLAIKPSKWRPLFDSAPWLVTCSLLAIVLTWLRAPLPGLSLTATAQIILLVGLARIGLAVVKWVPTWYLLTNRRVINVRGVRRPRILACLLLEVRNTYLHASVAEKAARLGTITFATDQAQTPPRYWQSIGHPEDVHAKIRRAIENAIDQQGVSG